MDEHDLARFTDAQDGTYERALAELRAGAKVTHWMWFVFPQVSGLGGSFLARQYAIASLAEARAYLAHPVLGPRLLDCCRAVLRHPDRTSEQVLGSVDALKLRSSMTLFGLAAPGEPLFQRVLDQWYGGRPDDVTAAKLPDLNPV